VVQEAESLLGLGAPLPRVNLAERDPGAGRTPLSKADWPKTAAIIDRASNADPAAAAPLASLAAPGRFGQSFSMPSHVGESDTFNHSLVLWTHRVKRA